MEVKIIDYADIPEGIFMPALVLGMLSRPTTAMVGAYAGDELIGFAVVIATEGESGHNISYFKTYGEQVEDTVAAILSFVEKLCWQANEDFLTVRLIDEVDELYDIDEILIRNGYSVISREGKYMMYYLQDIIETDFTESVCRNEAIKKCVYARNELNENLLQPFRDKQREHENNEMSEPDLVFGRYYVVDGVIRGYIDVREISDGVLVLNDAYVEKSPDTQMALVHMLAVLINTSIAFLAEDAVLYVYFQSDVFRKIFLQIFGEPEIDNVVYEYGKVLEYQVEEED